MPPPAPLALGFLGAGQMATALARGWINAALSRPELIHAADPNAEARARFAAAAKGCPTTPDPAAVLAAADTIILAVKPQLLSVVADQIRSQLQPRHLLISIAAGVTLTRLAELFGPSVRLMRVMPNTPCLVGASAAGFTPGPHATPADADLVQTLFSAVGEVVAVAEPLLDAITGVSGSGPAYVYMLIEAMADGGVRAGLSREVALKLAAQTTLGAAKMVLETGTHPAVLKDAVASPAGTTIAAIQALEAGGFRAAVLHAVQAAHSRAIELGRGEASR